MPVGETLRVVPINARPYKQGDYPGVVLINFGGFDDVPGLEVISEGICTTTLGSIAIGRQGRFLLWGFTGDPAGMTEAGREIFLNAVRYLHRKRKSLTVPFKCYTRYKLRFRCRSFLEKKREGHARTASFRRMFEDLLVPAARAELRERPPDGYAQWLEASLPYIQAGKSSELKSLHRDVYDVDRDARELGTPNHTLESLATWIKLATRGAGRQRSLARGCLVRYVDPRIRPANPAGWAGWLARMKDRIVFSDSAGFCFLEDPRARERDRP